MNDAYDIRPYVPDDRDAVYAMESLVLDWWHKVGASLHRVVAERETGAVVAHLQVKDRTIPSPSRHTDRCDMILTVAPAHRRKGIGSALYAEARNFTLQRGLPFLYASAFADSPGVPFLERCGFTELERFFPSQLDVTAFDPESFADAVRRVEAVGVRLLTYAEVMDTPENRRRVYELHQAAETDQPFRAVGPYVCEPYDQWSASFASWDKTALFLAESPTGEWIGLVSDVSWNFTGVRPEWRGRGIATALKVVMIAEAKRRGITEMPTENHEDNAAMLAINRKLGFVFGTPEIAFVKQVLSIEKDCLNTQYSILNTCQRRSLRGLR